MIDRPAIPSERPGITFVRPKPKTAPKPAPKQMSTWEWAKVTGLIVLLILLLTVGWQALLTIAAVIGVFLVILVFLAGWAGV